MAKQQHDPQAELWSVTDEEYYADEQHVNNERLRVVRESVPKYYRMYVAKTLPKPAATKSMNFGQAFHTMLLQPDKWKNTVAIAPSVNKATKAGKAVYEQFAAENTGKIFLTDSECDTLEMMAESVAANSEALKFLTAPGKYEQPVHWRDPETGLWCKLKADKLLDDGTIVDLKYSADPYEEGFTRSADKFGYDTSAAWYREGVSYLMGLDVPHVFIVCGAEPPCECFVYALDDDAITLGYSKNHQALRRLKDCMDLDDWSSRMNNKINTISLPRWSFNRSLVY